MNIARLSKGGESWNYYKSSGVEVATAYINWRRIRGAVHLRKVSPGKGDPARLGKRFVLYQR